IATLLPYTENSRDIARLLQLDAYVSAHDGDGARVLKDVKAIFSLSDALRGEPTIISQLVRIATYAMGCDTVMKLMPRCHWTDAELESLQAAILSARFRDELQTGLCGERVICLMTIDQIPLGPFKTSNKRENLRLIQNVNEGLANSWPNAQSRSREVDK